MRITHPSLTFLGLGMSDNVPDHNTVWLFRENLSNNGIIEEIFGLFNLQLKEKGILAEEGSIVDVPIAIGMETPRQRNSREENKEIKANKIPGRIQENPNVLGHKDLDARWTKKNGTNYFGYKNHIKVPRKKN